jgi:spermidine synthase
MAASLERRDGDRVALFINGDLQFDSTDERIYHEALALPALALAAKRIQLPLTVLVIGGGDGLVAREIFKSSSVASLDLVDYDPEILSFAQKDLSIINEGSLSDPRITIYNQDAWDFVDLAIQRSVTYDVIVSDLTVAENVMEARFHSVEWYAKLARLLSDQGVLAVNGVSPQATPQAYWCIFNSMLTAELHARPYHIDLPSFTAQGYGKDWGFFLASHESITSEELDADLSVATPREILRDSSDLLRLFIFPEELFESQPTSLPALAGSDILLHYFINAVPLTATSGAMRYTFALDTNDITLPAPDSGTHILPPALCSALAKSINSSKQYDTTRPEGVQLFLHEVLDLMPSLQKDQTAALISDFLEAPARFLQAIDLPALVARLLRRAAELPSHLVTELRLLQSKLMEWADDQENLLSLGHRVMSILILAIVVGNLLYPDAVYGKGSAGAHGSHSNGGNHAAAANRGGRRGGGWVGGGGWGYNNYNRRVVNPVKKGPIGPGPNDAAVKRMQKEGSLPQHNDISDAECIDESGNAYPARRYRTAQASSQTTGYTNAVYRLGPGADILGDGQVAMPLTDSSYLLLTPQATHVIEQHSGNCVMSLHNDPQLLIVTTAEVSRQLAQLSDVNEPSTGATQRAVSDLSRACEILQNAQLNQTAQLTMPIASGVEVFPSVHLTADGHYLAIKRENGQIAYLDGKNWYCDQGNTPLSEPYPAKFRSVAASYLEKMVRDTAATTNMLLADQQELAAHKAMLEGELSNYETSSDSHVNFGTRVLPPQEAIRLMQLALRKTELQIQALDKHVQTMPENVDTAKIALQIISDDRRA